MGRDPTRHGTNNRTTLNFPVLLWSTAAILLLVVTLLLLVARQPVAVRAVRVGGVAAVLAVLRLGMVASGVQMRSGWDMGMLITSLVIAVLLLPCHRMWLTRVDADQFRQDVMTVSSGLFLKCEELGPGHFILKTRGATGNLRRINLGQRLSLIVLPQRTGRGKIPLLVSWLDKQYSSPLPRPRIVLKRSEP